MEQRKDMPEPIPYIAYEGTMARFERTIKRLTICLIITVIMLVVSNLAWLYYLSLYDYACETVTTSQDGQGINIIGGGNNVSEGFKKTQDKNIKKQEEVKGN